MKKRRGEILLLLTTVIWGFAFVAQSSAMDLVGPWTFTFSRSLLAFVSLLIVSRISNAIARRKKIEHSYDKKATIHGGILCGILLTTATMFQQVGIQYTTVSKAGFITALYCVLVPLFSVFLGHKIHGRIWVSVLLSLIGLYLLCMSPGRITMESGDLLILVCAVFFSFHILVVDHYNPHADGILMSCIQFLVCTIISLIGMLMFEHFTLASVESAAVPILYAGIFSSAGGYTLQILGQKDADPTVASIILCLESVFSTLGGWLILHQSLSGREMLGCLILFVSIVLASLPEKTKKA